VNTTRELSRCAPDYENGWIYQAYGLRELNRIEEAKALLLAAESRHGKSGVLNYNLACYHCLLGEMADARARLRRACRLDPHWKTAALDDPDLKAMRDEIAAM
jgi:lipoprotein NlpI